MTEDTELLTKKKSVLYWASCTPLVYFSNRRAKLKVEKKRSNVSVQDVFVSIPQNLQDSTSMENGKKI